MFSEQCRLLPFHGGRMVTKLVVWPPAVKAGGVFGHFYRQTALTSQISQAFKSNHLLSDPEPQTIHRMKYSFH